MINERTMTMQKFAGAIKREGQGFFKAVGNTSELIYLILLTLYVLIYLILKTAWTEVSTGIAGNIRYALLSIVVWGSAMYLLFVIAEWKNLWKKSFWLIFLGALLLALANFFSRNMSTNAYGVVFDVFFCLMAAGKDYRKILRCIMYPTIAILIFAFIGIHTGLAADMVKPNNPSPGHSLGINYPNTWGYIAFLPMMIFWYLRLRHKPIFTFGLFWGMSAFMYFYISCRTVAVLTAVFPVAATVVDLIERWARRKRERAAESAEAAELPAAKVGWFGWIVTAVPFLSFAFMMYVSMQYKWVHKHFFHTKLSTFAERFMQGGLYFKTYGLPIFGNPYRSNHYTYVNVNGEFIQVGILDSSFAAYIIMRGMFWLTYTLAWLSYAIYKALRRLDYAIPFLTAVIMVFAMMERPGLEMWYCFILLYPLAKIANDPLEKAAEDGK